MDDLNFNKIAAGFLCGGLLMMAGIKTAEILLPHEHLETNAYPIEVPEGATATRCRRRADGTATHPRPACQC